MTQDDAVKAAAELCREFEGLSLKPYLCPAGVPTIGYGSTRYADGKQVTLRDQPITQAQAEALLQTTLKRDYLTGLLEASPVLAEHPKTLAALLDFCYNLGVSQYRYSTLRQRVNSEDWDRAKVELMKWVYGGGKILPGLVARRKAEIALMEA